MKKRLLGTRNSISVSEIGMGCMGFSHGYGNAPDKSTSINLIRKAYELGCTFFDTAESYASGQNEALVGEALKPIRKEVVIATKFHIQKPVGKSLLNEIKEHLAASMKRLQTDYIDLYYLHRVNPSVPLEDISYAAGGLIKEGLIGGWGVSQTTEQQVRLCHSITPLSAVQSEFSMMERMFEKDVIPACKELGIGFVPFSPLGAGFLSGKYTSEDKYSGDDVRRVITRFSKSNMDANRPLIEMLEDFAAEKNSTPAQIALSWMLAKYDFAVPIPGMRSEKRILENLGSADVTLTDDELKELERRLSKITVHGNRTDEDIMKLKDMI